MNFAERYGPWAVIAGASEGTGRAFARAIASRGVNCLLIARRAAPLEELAQQLRSDRGVDAVSAAVDLAAHDAMDRIGDAVGERQVGLFVNNAGADPDSAHFLDRDIATWEALVNRNVLTMMRCCHWFGGAMRERRGGGILLVGSGSCYGGAAFMSVYGGTKAFDLTFGESLWAELRPAGVDVLNLILGRTDTPAFRQTLAEHGLPVPDDLASPDEVAESGLARLPEGPVHNWGQADDEAGTAPTSAAARRARVEAISEATGRLFGDQ